jgi:hypothetical protein
MNVIGIAWNPSRRPLSCFLTEDMIDVRRKMNNQNGFTSFVEIMRNTFEKPKTKLFYWLFNIAHDKPDFDTYVNYSSTDVVKNIKTMIEELYNKYIILITKKLTNNVLYPLYDLDISNYIDNESPFKNKSKYNLIGINLHQEFANFGINAGHYTSVVKNRYDNNWYLFNDGNEPRKASIREDLQNRNAYMLFYYRE